jgi:hypothetical protein
VPIIETDSTTTIDGIEQWAKGNVTPDSKKKIRLILDLYARPKDKEFTNVTKRWDIDWFWMVDKSTSNHGPAQCAKGVLRAEPGQRRHRAATLGLFVTNHTPRWQRSYWDQHVMALDARAPRSHFGRFPQVLMRMNRADPDGLARPTSAVGLVATASRR